MPRPQPSCSCMKICSCKSFADFTKNSAACAQATKSFSSITRIMLSSQSTPPCGDESAHIYTAQFAENFQTFPSRSSKKLRQFEFEIGLLRMHLATWAMPLCQSQSQDLPLHQAYNPMSSGELPLVYCGPASSWLRTRRSTVQTCYRKPFAKVAPGHGSV